MSLAERRIAERECVNNAFIYLPRQVGGKPLNALESGRVIPEKRRKCERSSPRIDSVSEYKPVKTGRN